jgi:hypothetical protein
MKQSTAAEKSAFAAGARKAEQDRDIRSMERIAIALEKIVHMMEVDRKTGQ